MIAAIPLEDADGKQFVLSDFTADPLVVILVRYFGCLPCQDYLREMTAARDRFPADSRVIAVGGSAAYQARWLRESRGVVIPLLLDPGQRVRDVAGVGSLTAWQISRPRGIGNYLRSMKSGLPPQVPTSDIAKAPGIVVFDSNFGQLWVHRGTGLGDYPLVNDLIDRVVEMTR